MILCPTLSFIISCLNEKDCVCPLANGIFFFVREVHDDGIVGHFRIYKNFGILEE